MILPYLPSARGSVALDTAVTEAALALYTRGRAAGRAEPITPEEAERRRREGGRYAMGYDAGRAEGEAERVRATQEGIDIGRAQGWKEANIEIDRLVAVRAAERESAGVAIEGQAAEIARLTTALDAERALTTELRAMEAEALASADRWKAASERHEARAADLDALYQEQVAESQRLAADRERIEDERDVAQREFAEARAESAANRRLFESSRDSFDRYKHEHNDRAVAAADAARIEGARVEREACITDMRGECDGEEDREFMIRAAERIIRRAHAAAERARGAGGAG